MRAYKPRRAAARWLEGAPTEVLDIFDAGPKLADRYTVLFGGRYLLRRDDGATASRGNIHVPYLGMSENPRHPQGVGMWGELRAYEVADYRYEHGRERIRWTDLPDAVKECVTRSIAE